MKPIETNSSPSSEQIKLTTRIKRGLRRRARSLWLTLTGRSSSSARYRSETSKCRERLAPYCKGYGLDLGFGGDPITPHAIRMDQPTPYANTGSYPVQLGGDATNLVWFNDNTLDFIYSSHLLEDFVNTEAVLREWLRVLKPGGLLITFCPDEQIFRRHCAATGQPYNESHKHEHFSLDYVKNILDLINQTEPIVEIFPVDIYSWDLVVRKK
jgi:predicted SAM-dependent methyltransferase